MGYYQSHYRFGREKRWETGLIYGICAIIIRFREKIAKTTERRSPQPNASRVAQEQKR
jgi:hypothetical protein